ncbi:hypothetical protein WME79_31125 [Sorangium sp. So ce726]|uniref:hypothetical protein n=1 Tax=Sorangium sp. So ce726 TaxID=3133319 RepID=UPI003F5DF8EE
MIHMVSEVSGRPRHRTGGLGGRETPLDPERPRIVVSELLHQFDLDGQALFFVEFHRKTG